MNAVVAANADWGIGIRGKQTVIIPEDRRHFKKLTDGCAVIVGRKTFECIGGFLPNRKCIVLTHDSSYRADNTVVVHTLAGALEETKGYNADKVFVIGGDSVYRQLLPLCSLVYVTKIETCPPSDAFFPDLNSLPGWEQVYFGEMNERGDLRFSYNIYKNNSIEPL